jgi:hypothetical protein
MSLYCMVCSTVAGVGEAVCGNCRNGFTSKLRCSKCDKVVPSGYSYCPHCAQNVHVESSAIARPSQNSSNLPALALPPGLSYETAVVPEVKQNAGRFGVAATVHMSGRDADIMTKMNQVAMMLHALAAEMNTFQGIGDSTRGVIRGCRDLATRLQEEVEIRRGPL